MYRRNNNRGVITVLISLLLVGVLSIGTLVIEAGRFQAAKTQMAEANISAATSMIAAYDPDLYGRYGLLVIDTKRFKSERAADYLNFNADQAAGYRGNRLARMYVVDSVEMTGLYNLTYPSVMKRQILARAKYHVIPQNYALNVYTMDAFLTDFQNKCLYVADGLTAVSDGSADAGSMDSIDAQMREALTALYATYENQKTYDAACDVTLSANSVALLPSMTGTVENKIPMEDLTDIHATLSDATSVLGGSGNALSYNNGTVTGEVDVRVDVSFLPDIKGKLKDVSSASDLQANTKLLASKTRALAQGFSASINMLRSEDESNLLLNSYITEYFSNRNNRISTYSAPAKGTSVAGMDNAAFASACVEYVFGGNASETANQSEAYNYLQAIRLINNLYAVMTDSAAFDGNDTHSVAAHLAWANYESLVDMELLTVYGVSVPFNKNQMILPVDAVGSVAQAFGSKDTASALTALGFHNGTTFVVAGSNAFSYQESLAFGLWFVPNSEKLLRVADLIQLEMRYREQHVDHKAATFLMSEQNTYCRIKCVGRYSAVLPMISLDSGDSMRGLEIQSIKYAGY